MSQLTTHGETSGEEPTTAPSTTSAPAQEQPTLDNTAHPTEEFEFYFQFTKPLVLDLVTPEDRAVAAAWVQKLEVEPETEAEKQLRLDYLKLLLFVLQRGRLSGIFMKKPPSGPFQPFPPGFSMIDMGNLMIDQDDPQCRGAGEGGAVPYTIEISNDLREFVAAQEIPNFGVQMYYAWSTDEPVHRWTLFEEEKFPVYVLEKIKLLKEMALEERASAEKKSSAAKKTCNAPTENFSKKKVKSPQEIERSQGRSYHTYVGLAGQSGGFNGKNDQDQEKCMQQEQRTSKYSKPNSSTSRRYPQTHPLFREEEPGMLPPEAYDNFLNYSGSKFYDPATYCPPNAQDLEKTGLPQQLQQQQQQSQPQPYQDQQYGSCRGKAKQDGSPARGQTLRQKTSPRQPPYSSCPPSQIASGTSTGSQMMSCPTKKCPAKNSPPQTTQTKEAPTKVVKQKLCFCPPSGCDCVCPRPASAQRCAIPPGQERDPEERVQNTQKSLNQNAGQRSCPGTSHGPDLIHCFDPTYPDVQQQMPRQAENWPAPKEEFQQICPRQTQQPHTNTLGDDNKCAARGGRNIRAPLNQTPIGSHSGQVCGSKRVPTNRQMVDSCRYDGGFEADQAAQSCVNAQQMPPTPQWASPRGTVRPIQNCTQNLEEVANQNKRNNCTLLHDASMGRKKTEYRRDNQCPNFSREASPSGFPINCQTDSGRLANMNNMLEGIKQKTEAHRERCNQAGTRRAVQEDDGFCQNMPYFSPHLQYPNQPQTPPSHQRRLSPPRQPQQQPQAQGPSQLQPQFQPQNQRQPLPNRQPSSRTMNASRGYPMPRSQQPEFSYCPYQTLDVSDPGPSISARFLPNMNVAGTQKAPKNANNMCVSNRTQQPCRRLSDQYDSSNVQQEQPMRMRNVRQSPRGQGAGPYRNCQNEDGTYYEELCTDDEYDEEADECDVYLEAFDETSGYPQETECDYEDTDNRIQQETQCDSSRVNVPANVSRKVDPRTKQMLSSTPLNHGNVPDPSICGISTIAGITEDDYHCDPTTDFYQVPPDFDDSAYYDVSFTPIYGLSSCPASMQENSARSACPDKKKKTAPGR